MANRETPRENTPAAALVAGKRKKSERRRSSYVASESDYSESLHTGDDHFALIADGTEGGFLSLEEIDELEFFGGVPDSTPGSNKRKREEKEEEEERKRVDEGGDGRVVEVKERKKRRKKLKKRKKDRKLLKANKESVESQNFEANQKGAANDDEVEANADNEFLLDEDEVYAWNEFRLHPLVMKSIRRLGFREPTPIQKSCIPQAAHQGKDIVGAAETGSGKTLAFGLPILQRLLEEREKSSRLSEQNTKSDDGDVNGSHLRALIVTPTRELSIQVCDHLKEAARFADITIVPIVGGMSTEKQERLLKRRPEIVIGTPGRLWEMMSRGEQHLVELHSLSFFVLDEADRMIENGHFHELQCIIDMLPSGSNLYVQANKNNEAARNLQRKRRQTFVFSATIALSDGFRKKLRRGLSTPKSSTTDGLNSIEKLLERAGMRADTAVVDLTNSSIVANKLEESFIECSEEDKEASLYYLLTVHGCGRTVVFCTSIAALRRVSSMMRILGINAWTLHSQMQQRARLKALDRFRGNVDGVLIATDVAARGLDIPGIRTVIHYQLPHSAEVYIHRSGRTARASADGCSIALISPSDKLKFFSLCRSLSKETLRSFPLEEAYMPEVMKRLSLARLIDKISRRTSQENAKKNWFQRHAESVELALEDSGSEEETVKHHKQKKMNSVQLMRLQQELKDRLAQPLQPKTLSHRFLAGAGVSSLLHQQLEKVSKKLNGLKGMEVPVIGRDLVEPLHALRNSGREVCVSVDKRKKMLKVSGTLKKKRLEEKKREREQRRNRRRQMKEGLK